MKQASFDFEARAQGQIASEACAAAAVRRGWDASGAREFVLEFLRRNGSGSGEQIVNAAKKEGFIPHDDRAFGAIFGALSKAKLIRCVGTGCRSKGHGTMGLRWWEPV